MTLKWTQNDQQKTLTVPPYGSQYYDSSLVSSVQPKDIVVKAYNDKTNELIPIYGQKSYRVQASQHFGRHALMIGDVEDEIKDQVNKNPSKPITYKITFKLKNVADVPLSLKWNFNNRENSLDILAGASLRYTVTIKSPVKPPPIDFKVYKKGTNDLGQIDGKDSVTVQPIETALVSLWKLTYGK